MATNCSHRHAVPLLTNCTNTHPTTHTIPLHAPHHSHATNEHSTTCNNFTHTYTAVLNTHNIHTYTLLQKNCMLTHNPTTYINPPHSPHGSHTHMNSPLHPYSSHTRAYTPTQHCIHSPLFTHTHHQTSAYIYTPLPRTCTHTLPMQLFTYIHLYTHFHFTIHTPISILTRPITHMHTNPQAHTHKLYPSLFYNADDNALHTPLSLISRSALLPTCPSCICHRSLPDPFSQADHFPSWRL